MYKPIHFLLALLASSALLQTCLGDNKVLVLVNDLGRKDKFSSFFTSLQNNGFDLDIKGYRDRDLAIREHDQWLYDHLVIFAPRAESFGGNVNRQSILDFVDSGHNVLLAVNTHVSEELRQLGAEFGVDFDDKGTAVYDHFNYNVKEGEQDHTLIATEEIVNATVLVGSPTAPVLFKGIAITVPVDSKLVSVAVSAPSTSYSHDPRKPVPEPPLLVAGSAAALVTATQSRNNARMVVSGSVDLFTDELIQSPVKVASTGKTYEKAGNEEVALSLALWAFQAKGVIKAENLRHRIIDGEENPPLYRVTDDVEFLVDIFEYKNGKKTPYTVDDVQVEFTMLDPHVRLTLQHNGKGTYWVKFKVPDVYGVFKYTIQYKRLGYSYVTLSHQVPVRPFKHNEYERFLTPAYPYYTSAFSTMVAFFLVGFFFLYHK